MSACTLSLEQLHEIEQTVLCCRFCHCSESNPCSIYIAANDDGTERLARNVPEVVETRPCSWYLVGVCDAPECIAKLVEEKKGRVVLFDARGHEISRRRGGRHA
jgi:hypothetical protein